jgi:hypothetical protein
MRRIDSLGEKPVFDMRAERAGAAVVVFVLPAQRARHQKMLQN